MPKRALASLCIVTTLVAVAFLTGSARGAATTTLTFWTTEPAEDVSANIRKVLEEFEAQNPGIKVAMTGNAPADMDTKVVAALQAGDPPDVAQVAPEFVATYSAGMDALAPLNDIYGRIGTDDFFEPLLRRFAYKGGYYAVPWVGSTYLIWYRKDLFREKGLGVPKTWDEFEAAARKLTTDKTYGFAVPASMKTLTEQIFFQFLLTNGGHVVSKDGRIDFDTKETVETFEFYRRLYKTVSPPGTTTWDWPQVRSSFITGQVAMVPSSCFIIYDLEKAGPEVVTRSGAFVTPKKVAEGTFSGGSALVVFKKSKNLDAAKRLVEFLATPPGYLHYVQSRPGAYLPVRKSVASSKEYFANPTVIKFKDQIALAIAQLAVGEQYGLEGGAQSWSAKIRTSQLLLDAIQTVLLKDTNIREVVRSVNEELKLLAGQ